MGIAFVIGHTPYSKGAFSKYFNSSEWDFYNKYFTKINAVGNVFVHDNDLGYTSRQKEMSKKTRDFDIVFELHFNASNGTAHGCEALHYHLNDTAKKLVKFFVKIIQSKQVLKIEVLKNYLILVIEVMVLFPVKNQLQLY